MAFIAIAVPHSAQAEASSNPLPRFVSLRSDEVNLRTGPGMRYPIEWVLTKREMPVELIAEHDTWRKVRDPQGAEGWVHQTMLSGKRTILVTGQGGAKAALLIQAPQDSAPTIAKVEPGVVGRLMQCPQGKDYCKVELEGIQGWLKRGNFFGLKTNEVIE
jgi:SH3-like domain-containing protein